MSWPFGRCYCDFIKNARKELVKDDQYSVRLPRQYLPVTNGRVRYAKVSK